MAATSVSLGFRDVNGRVAYGCRHMSEWLPRFRDLVRQDLGVELEVVQALGSAAASAGTHGPPGTALDLRSWRFTLMQITALVKLARESGAPATWYRTPAQGFSPHVHLVIDCPCWSPADYQITAVKAGYNGLGYAGRGGKDDGPRPVRWRDYSEGMTWMSTQLGTNTLPTAPAPGLPTTGVDNSPQEDDMPLTDADLSKVATAVWAATFGDDTAAARLARAANGGTQAAANTAPIYRGGEQVSLRQEVADAKTMLIQQAGEMAGLRAALQQVVAGRVDLAGVEEAARRGAEKALAGARVEVVFEDGEQA